MRADELRAPFTDDEPPPSLLAAAAIAVLFLAFAAGAGR